MPIKNLVSNNIDLILTKIPLPPSANKQLIHARGRLIKSNAARIFDGRIQMYKLRHCRHLDEISLIAKSCLEKGLIFHVQYVFFLPYDQLFTKKKELKKRDTDNFIKSMSDAVAKLIEVDDKYFVKSTLERAICKSSEEEGHAQVKISVLDRLRTWEEVIAEDLSVSR